jgi:hypothetical protein
MNNITSNMDLKTYLMFLGVNNVLIRSKDNFENTYAKNGNYIVNLADANEDGTHWTALYIKGDMSIYFDSYGLAPPKHIQEFTRNKTLLYNTDHIQSFNSTACGYYCVLFLYHFNNLSNDYKTIKQYGYAINKFNQPFDLDNKENNDEILRTKLKNILML